MSDFSLQSYYPNYYDLDDIAATEKKVQCIVNVTVPKMGFLDSVASESEDLQADRKINLPLWYVREFDINNPYFTIQVPYAYECVYRTVYVADFLKVELGRFHQFFYELGRYLLPYDRKNTLGQMIYRICRQRMRYLLDVAMNNTPGSKPELKLDNLENKLYEAGMQTTVKFSDWLQFKKSNITSSNLVQEHSKKRKISALMNEEASTSHRSKKPHNY